jgi:F-type H+-transporting ATPase subunit a
MNTNYLLTSPMEQFEVINLFSLNLNMTNFLFYLLIGVFLTFIFSNLDKGLILGNNWSIINETMYRTVLNMIHYYIGKNMSIYFPFLYTLFYIILFTNLIGLIPYSYTSTVQVAIVLVIGISLLFSIIVLGFIRHGSLLLGLFIPAGTPIALVPLMIIIELISYLTRTFSLGLRLSVNMITGHTLVKVFSGMIYLIYIKVNSILVILLPLILLSIFLALEILIAYLQVYIFTFLTCITIKDFT